MESHRGAEQLQQASCQELYEQRRPGSHFHAMPAKAFLQGMRALPGPVEIYTLLLDCKECRLAQSLNPAG